MLMPAGLTRSRPRGFLARLPSHFNLIGLLRTRRFRRSVCAIRREQLDCRRCFPSPICSICFEASAISSRCRIEYGRNDFLSRSFEITSRLFERFWIFFLKTCSICKLIRAVYWLYSPLRPQRVIFFWAIVCYKKYLSTMKLVFNEY